MTQRTTHALALTVIESFSARERIQPTDRLEDLGLDSLDRVQLTIDLEARLGITIDDDAAAEWQTVDDVIAYAQAAYGQRAGMNTAATAPAAIRLTAIQHNLLATLSDGRVRNREDLRASIGRIVQYPHHLKPLLEAGLVQSIGVAVGWQITDRGSQYLIAWRERRGVQTAPVDG